MVLGGTLARGKAEGLVAEYSWYVEMAILVHVPPLSGVCVLGMHVLVLALLSDTGRDAAVDWLWVFSRVGVGAFHFEQRDIFIKFLGSMAIFASILATMVFALLEVDMRVVPDEGHLDSRPALTMTILASVISLETFFLDLRLVPKRFLRRVVVFELSAICCGMVAGLVILLSYSRLVVVLVLTSWLAVFSAAFLRDHCTAAVRRRIEEPIWS
uniref:Transmembrane protein n=1 Tax=Alexandrium catenella TaxID=2925 RepID=A0A7S1W972_ALECA